MSGPASGVMAAAYTGRASGHPNLITYDMGGTSTDVGLIRTACPQVSARARLEYAMPIHVPMVDVHTIGAGGGSIASVDAAGMLRVGPESAGAQSRARSATAAAAPNPPSPTPTWCWAGSIPIACWASTIR